MTVRRQRHHARVNGTTHQPVLRSMWTALAAGASLLACLAAPAQKSAVAQKPAATHTPTTAAATTSADGNRANSYYHYALAKTYEGLAQQSGRQDYASQAIEEYKLALGADPNSTLLQDGLPDLYFRLGRIRDAISSAKDLIARNPNDVSAHELLGRVYLRSLGDGQGDATHEMLGLAIGEYETIVRLKPNDLEAHLLLAQLYGLNHDSTKAEAELRAAQRIDGSSQEVVLSMARLYTEQGDLKRAAGAIEAVPPAARTVRMDLALAGIYDGLQDEKKAAAAYQQALDLEPDNDDAKRGLASALFNNGQLDAARKQYSELAGRDPDDAQSLVRLAEIQRQQGQYEQALASLKKAQAQVSNNAELDYNLGLTYDALGQFDAAVAALNKAMDDVNSSGNDAAAQNSNRALFLERIALIDREAGKTDDAVAAYGREAQLGDDFRERAAEGVIDSYRDAHQWKQALNAAAAAARVMPAKKDVQLAYARQLADNGDLAGAVKLAKAQLKGGPDDKDVLYTLADMYTRAGQYKLAYDTLDSIAPLTRGKDEEVFLDYYRGTVADRQKQYEQAELDFRKGLALAPDSIMIQNDLGYMLAERGKQLPEAIAMLQKAVAADPQNGAYLDSLAWAYFRNGQYAMAEDCARRAALRSPDDPAVLDHLGQIYEHNGKLQLAVDAWQKSVAAYATSLPPEAEPADVARATHRLDAARVRLAKAGK